ncbi:S-layer homology domain-containing protein [Pelotomaculum sp. PtaB.Bin117]|nr:S-layer homology domain-containing protein [Pelotomaculum sp. PtaB.Bin117]
MDGRKAEVVISEGDKSKLPPGIQNKIGDKPLIQLTLLIDGKQTDWKNSGAPVTVSIPYKPTPQELRNPQGIVVWYIDGDGRAVSVPNGKYDPRTGMVTFTTTHFSDYAVAYNPVEFGDVAEGAWYYGAVSFIAAREITNGTGGGNYSPEAGLTRGEFIVLMMRAYGIDPDENPAGNFADAGDTYYTGYLAAAKRLGISAGVGSNLYAPDNQITRQEMFTLLYNALKVIEQLPEGILGKALTDFADSGDVAAWATEAMTLLVETGTVSGSGGRLNPTGTTTRAEMAQVLYNLLGK